HALEVGAELRLVGVGREPGRLHRHRERAVQSPRVDEAIAEALGEAPTRRALARARRTVDRDHRLTPPVLRHASTVTAGPPASALRDRKSTRLNSSHLV